MAKSDIFPNVIKLNGEIKGKNWVGRYSPSFAFYTPRYVLHRTQLGEDSVLSLFLIPTQKLECFILRKEGGGGEKKGCHLNSEREIPFLNENKSIEGQSTNDGERVGSDLPIFVWFLPVPSEEFPLQLILEIIINYVLIRFYRARVILKVEEGFDVRSYDIDYKTGSLPQTVAEGLRA